MIFTNNNNNRLTALCPGLPGWASTRRNVHPPIILIIIQSLSASSMYFPCTVKSRSSLLAPAHPGGLGKRAIKWMRVCLFHLLWSIASSLFKLRAWQSFCTTSLSSWSTSWYGALHLIFTQSVSSFRNTCPYHHYLFGCSIKIISSFSQLLTWTSISFLA